ncbi:MAG: hypothetical protein JF616_16425 [Fibrobacteres bacterium]|nr:hypothetical protein [Fibrobacterota bacterium]
MNRPAYIGGEFRDGDNAPFLNAQGGDAERYFPARIGGAERACFETGSDALAAILASLGGPKRVWVPSHFCMDSIARARQKAERAWEPVRYDDLEGLPGNLEKGDALLFLHFNARNAAHADRAAALAAQAGAALIEDFVHAPLEVAEFRGEAAFNSLRKFARLEVAIAYSRRGSLSGSVRESAYFRAKRKATRAKDAYAGTPDPLLEREYLDLYRTAEAALQGDPGIVYAHESEMEGLGLLDFGAMQAIRRRNHAYLAERLSATGITTLPGDYAYAMARFRLRDALRDRCFALGIFPAIHWRDCGTALSREILAFHIDQRYGQAEMDRIADAVAGYSSMHSSSA